MHGVQLRVKYTMCRSSDIAKHFGARQGPDTFSNFDTRWGSDIVQNFGPRRRSGIAHPQWCHSSGIGHVLTVGTCQRTHFGKKWGAHKRSQLPLKKTNYARIFLLGNSLTTGQITFGIGVRHGMCLKNDSVSKCGAA